ncbi:hypothetical protein [Acinetobacter zhairhuonensis]|uniref:hypothetical protein n=1 Tax=Acinetobacter sp. A7.4 TaxID=2919921 RepID=UPI001F4F9507|nr:hypothetical protein [Acinetobacter sp. A7.4]MCJ8161863.1 hypothetical protein [Acinetobacter sp. A7.4]
MKRRYLLGLAFLSVLQGATAAEIYTCNLGGETVYQGKPCAGSKELRDKVNNAKAQESSRQQAYERQKAEWAARVEPRIGMSAQQAEKSTWGYPDKVNKTTNVYGVSEQWVYRMYRGQSRYLYFTNGILTSMQD